MDQFLLVSHALSENTIHIREAHFALIVPLTFTQMSLDQVPVWNVHLLWQQEILVLRHSMIAKSNFVQLTGDQIVLDLLYNRTSSQL
jgi:hypothetical protein